jgi:methionyl-tRNA formyltransferase
MKIAYCGYDFFFGCFERVVALGHEITAVFSCECDGKVNFNDRLRTAAVRIGVSFSTTRLRRSDLRRLADEGCELLISAAYPYRIPVHDTPAVRGCNIHPTLLPEGRGPWPLPHLILKGCARGGVTIHKLTPDLDAGDILLQESFPLSEVDDLESVSCRVQMLAPQLLERLLGDFEKSWSDARSQGPSSHWPAPSWPERTLDWTEGVDEVLRVVRAFGKFESCATFGGKDWVVRDAVGWREAHTLAPGAVAHEASREVVIAVADGFVCLRYFDIDPDWKELPTAVKSEMLAADNQTL